MIKLRKTATTPTDQGKLQINVTSATNRFPIDNATISISDSFEPDQTLEEVTTNSSGQSPQLTLAAPPLDYSLEAGSPRPYTEYTLRVTAPGFEPVLVTGTEVLPNVLAIQPIQMRPLDLGPSPSDDILIPDHTLYGDYPPKIAEPEIKPLGEDGEIVLSRVVVPEIIIVHDGAPNNSSARNYYVPYKDYIKNVASSEIYATWPESTITANILAIMSFTMNRVYTEFYRNRGYEFTITSSTAYDHKWIYGRNIYEDISRIVDDIFTDYLSRPDVKQPILTQYCDGKRVTCPNWMTQWGSKNLGDQGYSPIEILRHYYGDDMYINTAEIISGIPSSWPGSNLQVGTRSDKVRQMQEQLDTIRSIYTAIPPLIVDGIFGAGTEDSVREFQSIFGLPATGIVDYATWYKISEIYVAVTRIAELV
ncbi:MAG: peptidoglycan-binding protein [Lachnospiraceae bacterium]|nr:peptidoglycan-binding protein [Lachnospiraceae bacterium]